MLETQQQILLNCLSEDGLTSQNVNQLLQCSLTTHGVVVVSNVKGEFSAGETIVGQTSSNTATIQADTIGRKGLLTREITMSNNWYGRFTYLYS